MQVASITYTLEKVFFAAATFEGLIRFNSKVCYDIVNGGYKWWM